MSTLTADELVNLDALAKACRLNARQLAFEADLLRGNGHRERAYFLALSGLEELAKAELVADFRAGLITRQQFSRAFADHKWKFAYRQRRVSRGTAPKTVDIAFDPSQGTIGTAHREGVLYVGHGSGFAPVPPALPSGADLTRAIEVLHNELSALNLLDLFGGANSRVALNLSERKRST